MLDSLFVFLSAHLYYPRLTAPACKEACLSLVLSQLLAKQVFGALEQGKTGVERVAAWKAYATALVEADGPYVPGHTWSGPSYLVRAMIKKHAHDYNLRDETGRIEKSVRHPVVVVVRRPKRWL